MPAAEFMSKISESMLTRERERYRCCYQSRWQLFLFGLEVCSLPWLWATRLGLSLGSMQYERVGVSFVSPASAPKEVQTSQLVGPNESVGVTRESLVHLYLPELDTP